MQKVAFLQPFVFFGSLTKKKRTIARTPAERVLGARSMVRTQESAKAVAAKRTAVSGVRAWSVAGLVAANVGLLVFHFVAVNMYVAKGYEIQELQTSIRKQETENKKLAVQTSEILSVSNVQESLASAHFVPVTSAEFITPHQYTQR